MSSQGNLFKKDVKVPPRSALIEGEHYYINEQGYWVFTEKYHLQRGFCCNSRCKHCPYGNQPDQ